MELKTCTRCRRLFQYLGFGDELCPACKQKDEEEFQDVKKYIMTHPNSKLKDVSKETKVSEKRLTEWIKEERLVVPDTFDTGLRCAQCGAVIQKGTLCDSCKEELAEKLSQAGGRIRAHKETLKDKVKDKKGMQFIIEEKKE